MQSAALLLTVVTAYEALFERLKVPREKAGSVLSVGGVGGVGSIAIQLLRTLTDAEVYATASRPESIEWVQSMGAQHVIDRRTSLLEQCTQGRLPEFDYIFSTMHSDSNHAVFPLKPFGALCLIDDPSEFDVAPFITRAQSVHWELMFTKTLFDRNRES